MLQRAAIKGSHQVGRQVIAEQDVLIPALKMSGTNLETWNVESLKLIDCQACGLCALFEKPVCSKAKSYQFHYFHFLWGEVLCRGQRFLLLGNDPMDISAYRIETKADWAR
jgi:hypothetical protein